MKKNIIKIIILLLMPITVMAMENISDTELEQITGKAGITLHLESGTTELNYGLHNIAWGDDGYVVNTGTMDHALVRIDMLTVADAEDTLERGLRIAEGENITVDIDATDGIVIGVPDFNIYNNDQPYHMRISINADIGGAGNGATTDFTTAVQRTQVLGYLKIEIPTVPFYFNFSEPVMIKPH